MPHNQQYLDTVLNPGQSSIQPAGFSSAQQSQQARSKPYASPTAGEAYEARRKREQAALILGSLELLVWHANVRNEVRISISPCSTLLNSEYASIAISQYERKARIVTVITVGC